MQGKERSPGREKGSEAASWEGGEPSAGSIPAPAHTDTLWRGSLSTARGKCSPSVASVEAGWRDAGVTQNACERGQVRSAGGETEKYVCSPSWFCKAELNSGKLF